MSLAEPPRRHWEVGGLYMARSEVWVCVYLDDTCAPRVIGMVRVGSNPFFKHVVSRGPDWWYRRMTKLASPRVVDV